MKLLNQSLYYSRTVRWERNGDKVERIERTFNTKGTCIRMRPLPINDRPRDWSTIPTSDRLTEYQPTAKRDWLINQEYMKPGKHVWAVGSAQWFGLVDPYESDRTGYKDDEGNFVPYTGCFIVTDAFVTEENPDA